jgi:outer membrane lipoprotein-sorting protein
MSLFLGSCARDTSGYVEPNEVFQRIERRYLSSASLSVQFEYKWQSEKVTQKGALLLKRPGKVLEYEGDNSEPLDNNVWLISDGSFVVHHPMGLGRNSKIRPEECESLLRQGLSKSGIFLAKRRIVALTYLSESPEKLGSMMTVSGLDVSNADPKNPSLSYVFIEEDGRRWICTTWYDPEEFTVRKRLLQSEANPMLSLLERYEMPQIDPTLSDSLFEIPAPLRR